MSECAMSATQEQSVVDCARSVTNKHSRQGTLVDFEREYRSNAEVIEEWEFLQKQGYGRRDAAERLGMKRAALDTAIARHKRAVR